MGYKWVSKLYIASIVALFLYSYTQVDLSLTLSKISLWQTIEKWFQYIGYFNRPVSTIIYIVTIFSLLYCFIAFLSLVEKNKVSRKQVWLLILITTGILTFSYNAFSYDLFNYIFDAKIFTHYHLNPYAYKALDFHGDPMLSFMHWTQRVYPYGPFWLLLTVPLSFLGGNIFLLTFFLFKILMTAAYLGTAWCIEKILEKENKAGALSGLVFFAFNPLIIIESLVSTHIDIVMLFFFMVGLFLASKKGYINSIIMYLFSIGIKFATAFAAPVYFWIIFKRKKTGMTFEKEILWMTVLISAAVIAQSVRTNFQPWYLLDVIPVAALIGRKYYVLLPAAIISIFALFQYIWFLYTGNFNPPFPTVSFWITASSILFTMICLGFYKFRETK